MAAEMSGTSAHPNLSWYMMKEKVFARVVFTPVLTTPAVEQKVGS